MGARSRRLREAGLRVVFTNGCFDILHIGHVRYLQAARSQGDALIVGVNSDRSIRELKGPDRPIVPAEERAAVLAALECVDAVSIFDERQADDLIRAVMPEIYVKGGDYTADQVPETPLVRALGGEVRMMPLIPDRSTTRLIHLLQAAESSQHVAAAQSTAVAQPAAAPISGPVVAVIPARFASTPFPGKPLTPIAGRPMIQWVYERASRARSLNQVLVATDDERIAAAVRSFGGSVVMTSPNHACGTDRLAEVALSLPETAVVVNVQGDEPLIAPESIDLAVESLHAHSEASMSTLIAPCLPEDWDNPNVVKAVVNEAGFALYFSRSRIPFPRAANLPPWKHIGLYAYRRDFLLRFAALPPTPLEGAEALEQLRALEWGFKIACVVSEYETVGVDSPEDVPRAEARIAALRPDQ